jgi:hypothetical protein
VGLSDFLELLRTFGFPLLVVAALFFGELVPRRPYVRNLETERDYWRIQAETSAAALRETAAQLSMSNQLVTEMRAIALAQGAVLGHPQPAEGRPAREQQSPPAPPPQLGAPGTSGG